MPDQTDVNTARAQLVLLPITSSVAGGVDFVGGANSVFASNIANTDNGHNYYGSYFQDDWKVTPKLTLNYGLRWESETWPSRSLNNVTKNFDPRVGFSYGLGGSRNFIVRGGAGILW